MDSRTGVLVIIVLIAERSHRDVVTCCMCLSMSFCCFICFVCRAGCGIVVVIILFMYLAIFFVY